jgi:hypothetical protein
VFIKQLYNVLKLFSEFTKLVLSRQPTITIATSIYFQLLKHLKLASNCKDKYTIYNTAITNTIYKSLELFNKYYNTIN